MASRHHGDLPQPERFSKDTARKTGKPKRTIQRKVKIGKALAPIADKLKGTVVEDNQRELLKLPKSFSSRADKEGNVERWLREVIMRVKEERWTDSDFFKRLNSPEHERIVREIFKWAKDHHLQAQLEPEKYENPTYFLTIECGRQKDIKLIAIRASANPWIELMLGEMKKVPPFKNDSDLQHELLEERWKKNPAVRCLAYDHFPNIDLALTNDVALQQLFETISWMVQQIRSA